jgi:hypothetical protein
MPDARASIEKHYGFDGLTDRIMAARHDTANLTVEMLNLYQIPMIRTRAPIGAIRWT